MSITRHEVADFIDINDFRDPSNNEVTTQRVVSERVVATIWAWYDAKELCWDMTLIE